MNFLAQNACPPGTPPGTTCLGTIGGGGLGPFGNIGTGLAAGAEGGTAALIAVTKTISGIIGIMTIAGVIWFMFQFITGGYLWIHSGGDKQKLHEARERITNSFIGLLIVVAGWAILALMGIFLGFDTVISDPEGLIEQLGIK